MATDSRESRVSRLWSTPGQQPGESDADIQKRPEFSQILTKARTEVLINESASDLRAFHHVTDA